MDTQTILKVINADMQTVIEQYSSNSETGFAHCISKDFGKDLKHMSQGVAVTFKEKFGKPIFSDYCGSNFTRQKTTGAKVYSLVTKPEYIMNATNYPNYLQDYDNAFSQMTDDFIKQNLKTLICSPLGCVRDRVPVPHFVSNLMKFKLRTGAAIMIVTCRNPSNKRLYSGLPYESFVSYLRQTIVNKYFEHFSMDAADSCCPDVTVASPLVPTTPPPLNSIGSYNLLSPTQTQQSSQRSSLVSSVEGGIKVNGGESGVVGDQMITFSDSSQVQPSYLSQLFDSNISVSENHILVSVSENGSDKSGNFLGSMSLFPPLL